MNSSESYQPLRDHQQITFFMLNRFWSLSKTPLALPIFIRIFPFLTGTPPSPNPTSLMAKICKTWQVFCQFSQKCLLKHFFFQKFIDKIWQILWSSFQNIFEEQLFWHKYQYLLVHRIFRDFLVSVLHVSFFKD